MLQRIVKISIKINWSNANISTIQLDYSSAVVRSYSFTKKAENKILRGKRITAKQMIILLDFLEINKIIRTGRLHEMTCSRF